MLHPTWLELVATERRRDLLAATHVRPIDEAPHPKRRERLGRLFTVLGLRLSRDAPARRSVAPGRITEESYRLAAHSTTAGAEHFAKR